MILSSTEKAYLAGIIDGEGAITIAKIRTPRNYGKRIYWTYSLKLSVANTDPYLMEWIRKKFDVKIYNHRNKDAPGNWKLAFVAIFDSKKTISILKMVQRYLIVKKPHAKIIIDEWPQGKKKIANPALRASIREKILILNKRGKEPEETERARAETAFGYATVRSAPIQESAEKHRNDVSASNEVMK